MRNEKRKRNGELSQASKKRQKAQSISGKNIHDIRWNSSRPPEYSALQWRRMQVQKYIKANQNAEDKEANLWIRAHQPIAIPTNIHHARLRHIWLF